MSSKSRDAHSFNPVVIQRFTTGLVTNRDPLHPPLFQTNQNPVPRLDALIDGLNTEISPRQTIIRRPGFPQYCSEGFDGDPLGFAQFRVPNGGLHLILDTTTDVWEFDTTSITARFSKSTLSQSFFQQVGDRMYFADGTTARQWYYFLDGPVIAKWGIDAPAAAPGAANIVAGGFDAWAATTFYSTSLILKDSNNNIQKLTTSGTTGGSQPSWSSTPGATTADNTAVWTCQGQAARQTTHAYATTDYIQVDYSRTVTYHYRDPETHEIVETDITTNYSDFFRSSIAGTSSATATGSITWTPGVGSLVHDGTVTWINSGTKITWVTIGAAYLVTTIQAIADTNGNLQTVTKTGKSGALAPTWSTVLQGNTTDGTTAWRNDGPVSAANSLPWKYVYTFRNEVTNHSSTASDSTPSIFLNASSNIAVSGFGSDDTQVSKIDIYRTKQAGGIYYLLDTVTNPGSSTTAWSYIDTKDDSLLNTEAIAPTAHINDPPPAGGAIVAFFQGRVWMASGSNLYFDGGGDVITGDPHQAFPPANVFPYASAITGLAPTTQGLVVFLSDETHVILGGPQTLTFFSQPLFQGLGISSPNCLRQDGDQIFILTSQGQAISFSPSDRGEFGHEVADLIAATFPPASSYLALHRSGPDVGIFLSDNTANILRFNPNFDCWNPLAQPVGGCGPVASLETGVGSFSLLTTVGGFICRRDTTSALDGAGASTYAATGTLGSIEVQPMSLPTINPQSVFARHRAIGSRPSISVLQNATSGTFHDIPYGCSVPFRLSGTPLESVNPAQSRYDFAGAEGLATGAFNHFQLKVSWPAENALNELTFLSVGGEAQ